MTRDPRAHRNSPTALTQDGREGESSSLANTDAEERDLFPAALEVSLLRSGYEDVDVLHGVSLSVPAGSVVAVLGPNGAGKTTLLRTISGFLPLRGGFVSMRGDRMDRRSPVARAKHGLCDIPEGRGIFGSLTVRENIRMFAPADKRRSAIAQIAEDIPMLRRLMNRTAGTLSGGEQQMLALSRAYLADPVVILIDEVSLGLAPIMVDQVFGMLAELKQRGTAMLIVEQYIQRALALADTACVLNRGRVVFSGRSDEALSANLHEYYFQLQEPDSTASKTRAPRDA